MWFFVEGTVAFDRSTMGPMLDRAEMFTFGSMVCPECEGVGYVGDPEQCIREAIEKVKAWPQDQLDKLRDALRGKTDRGEPNPFPGWYDDGSCPKCGGCGWIPRAKKNSVARYEAITARPTGSSIKKRGGVEPNADILERYGHVLKRLGRLTKAHQATLGAFFGLAGGRWADDRYRGRVWGLMPLTPAGHKLVKSSRDKVKKGDGAPLTDDQVLNVEAELENGKPQKIRGALLKAAREQAEEKLREAEKAWGGEEEKTIDRLRQRIERMRRENAA
jgi:hypothetical protein